MNSKNIVALEDKTLCMACLKEKAEQRIQKILYSALTISKILELLHLLQPASQ